MAAYLLQHELFPRSVLYSLQRAEATLGRLTGSGPVRNRTQILLGRLRSSLEFADLADPATTITSVCDELEDGIRHVAESMGPQYFRSADEAALHAQFLLPGEVSSR